MIRVLILEDAPTTTEQLRQCLRESLTGVVVDDADTAEEALRQARDSVARGQSYDVVILDAKVPKTEGNNPEVHPEVCLEIGRKMPNALIVNFTAFAKDPAVGDKLRDQLREPLTGRPVLIDKNDPNYMAKLLQMVNRFLFGNRIQARMANLFGVGPVGTGNVIRERSPAMKVAHVTQELAALTRDISAHWDCLSEPMQASIREVFFVDEKQQPVYVSLLDPTASSTDNR